MYFAHKVVETSIKYEFGSDEEAITTTVVHNGSGSAVAAAEEAMAVVPAVVAAEEAMAVALAASNRTRIHKCHIFIRVKKVRLRNAEPDLLA